MKSRSRPISAPNPSLWRGAGSGFALTLNALLGAKATLTRPDVAPALLSAAKYYHDLGTWDCRFLLIMPDSLHALVAFPETEGMRRAVGSWKQYTARAMGVAWQRGFDYEELVEAEAWQAHFALIRDQPVRAGLSTHAENWPWTIGPCR